MICLTSARNVCCQSTLFRLQLLEGIQHVPFLVYQCEGFNVAPNALRLLCYICEIFLVKTTIFSKSLFTFTYSIRDWRGCFDPETVNQLIWRHWQFSIRFDVLTISTCGQLRNSASASTMEYMSKCLATKRAIIAQNVNGKAGTFDLNIRSNFKIGLLFHQRAEANDVM